MKKSTQNANEEEEPKVVNNFIDECLHLLVDEKSLTNDDLIIQSITMLLAVCSLYDLC